MSQLAYRHQRVQLLRRLVRSRRAREELGCFVVEGVNLLEEALEAKATVQAVYLDGEWASRRSVSAEGEPASQAPVSVEGERASRRLAPPALAPPALAPPAPGGAPHSQPPGRDASADRLEGLLARCYGEGVRVFELGPGVLARVAGTVTPQPVLAVVRARSYGLEDIRARGGSLVVVCLDVRDPGNAGTVVRSAWAAGADGVVCCGSTVDPYNPKAVRASAGAVLHIPVVQVAAAAEALEVLGQWGLARWGTVAVGGEDYARADLRAPIALVFGNESNGLPLPSLAAHLDGLLSVPMPGGAGSLNVGMAAAVLCFEAVRQRRCAPQPGGGQKGTK